MSCCYIESVDFTNVLEVVLTFGLEARTAYLRKTKAAGVTALMSILLPCAGLRGLFGFLERFKTSGLDKAMKFLLAFV